MSGNAHTEPRSWFVRHRQQWIAEMLHVYGFINRAHIQRKFLVSLPQASADLSLFQKENPLAIEYDKSAKMYRSAKE